MLYQNLDHIEASTLPAREIPWETSNINCAEPWIMLDLTGQKGKLDIYLSRYLFKYMTIIIYSFIAKHKGDLAKKSQSIYIYFSVVCLSFSHIIIYSFWLCLENLMENMNIWIAWIFYFKNILSKMNLFFSFMYIKVIKR